MTELTVKENIIQSAKEIFYKKGFKGTTIRDISEQSGSKAPLIIYHFKNKENLFTEVLNFVATRNFTQVEGILDEAGTKEEFVIKLKLFNKKIMQTMADDISGVLLSLSESETPGSEFYTLAENDFVKFNTTLMDFLTMGIKKKYIPSSVDIPFFLNLYWGLSTHRLKMNFLLTKNQKLDIKDDKVREKWLNQYNQVVLEYLRLV